ncbi:hypothetical protein Tsp_13882 [Trichinella spiralis]|uniref:hypothetical protein n=1 Tax=Trichinella spiralis TaxID=6334 RepID=UPI0001EFDC90|nr:hypothetical protein Tsp_13882 [Trichinella spiralis]
MGSQTFRVRHQEQKCCSLVEHSDRMKRYYAREFAGDRSFRGGTTRQQEHHPSAAERTSYCSAKSSKLHGDVAMSFRSPDRWYLLGIACQNSVSANCEQHFG